MSDAVQARLAALAGRWGLEPAQSAQLARLLERLESDPHAPTAVREPREAVEIHVADSLSGLAVDALRRAATITDVGSGAGLPGLVVAAALPEATVFCLESQARKCAFIERAVRAMDLGNVEVVCERAELWNDGAGRSDAVLARALAPQPVVLEYAAPLLVSGGVLIDWRGRRSAQDEATAERAAGELGMRRVEITAGEPAGAPHEHHLHVFEKVAPTPSRFPRRPGAARKRPLGV